MTTPAHLATPKAFASWCALYFTNVILTELRPDGRGIVVTRTELPLLAPYFCGYVVGGAQDIDLDRAPCHGGVTFAADHGGTSVAGFDFCHAGDDTNPELTSERARREAHALADWLSAETEGAPTP